MLDKQEFWMKKALELASQAAEEGEVPVGAVVVFEDQIVGEGRNQREIDHDPTAHAELRAIQAASKNLQRWRLHGCELYVTLEPCAMCAGATVLSRIDRLIYGATDPKAGAIQSLFQIAADPRLNHRVEIVSGVLYEESATLLKEFFRKLRNPS